MVKVKLKSLAAAAAGAVLVMPAVSANAQTAPSAVSGVAASDLVIKGPATGDGRSQILRPDSGIAKPGDIGQRARTHYRIVVPSTGEPSLNKVQPQAKVSPNVGPPFSGYYYNTPASLACIYGLVASDGACNPNTFTTVTTGGSKAIAIVDAYHYSSALSDLQAYSTQFGLPAPNLTVVFASGSQPAANSGWTLESALDIQMAHAMAPNAHIYLVEAASASFADLDVAVDKAVQLVQAAGGGQVSMSYGGGEFAQQVNEDVHFQNKTNVVFFASTGDDPGIEFPSSSPNVVAVGGTTIARAWAVPANRGKFREESAWDQGGSGYSAYFPQPAYQNGVGARLGNMNARVTPDISAIANPNTPVWVLCTACTSGGWFGVGGTSAAAPLMAGLVNNAGQFRANTQAQLTFMYSKIGTNAYFDVRRSFCGPEAGYYATTPSIDAPNGDPAFQFDLCTGLGSPRGLSGL